MEIRTFAERILLSPSLSDKLTAVPEKLTDDRPGSTQRVALPAREDHLRFDRIQRPIRMPRAHEFARAEARGIAHHIMAHHELQALEIMAWTLLAFPDAPSAFRREIVAIMVDEQRHTRMHLRRLESVGAKLGDYPLSGHVWARGSSSQSLLEYLACLPLTFEGGNLDHSLQFASFFHQAGDSKGREIMKVIHSDEIEHVAFGLRWLRQLKPVEWSDWQAYEQSLRWPLTPYSAKGKVFQKSAREQAGMSPDFIASIQAAPPRERHRRIKDVEKEPSS